MKTLGTAPTILVAFGVTGDLMRLKILPALFQLFLQKSLPNRFRVIGFSRKEWSDEQFREYLRDILSPYTPHVTQEDLISFLTLFQFENGDFSEQESYQRIKKSIDHIDADWGVCSNKLFYLAVAPIFYTAIFQDLSRAGLTEVCNDETGWTHVVIEKPFGGSGTEAHALEFLLKQFFQEEQIYRIDHYLAKEMLQNVLDFRFAHHLFDIYWGNKIVESIHLKLFENVGVEKRGHFYDQVGALRDVGQNHLLEMLALLTMDRPETSTAEAIRRKRADLLETLEELPPSAVASRAKRAQYEGYRDIPGVHPDSTTETYFNIQTKLNHSGWEGVPIFIEGGKRLGESTKEIEVRLRHPTNNLSSSETLLFQADGKNTGTQTAEYERLILDCIRGDQTLFVSEREVQAMWRFVDPIIRAWEENGKNVGLLTYVPDTKPILNEASNRLELNTNKVY